MDISAINSTDYCTIDIKKGHEGNTIFYVKPG